MKSIEAFATGSMPLVSRIEILIEVEFALAHVSTPRVSTRSISTPTVSRIASAPSLALRTDAHLLVSAEVGVT